MANRSKSKRQRRRSSNRPGRGVIRRVFPYLFLLGSLVLAGVCVYAAYLNGIVLAKFDGALWELPAKVYASPMQLYAGKERSIDSVVAQLKRQGYQSAASPGQPGTFHRDGKRLVVYVRGFDFWGGQQRPPRKISMQFANDTITAFKAVDDKGSLALIRFDPPLIGSIYPNRGADRILVKLSKIPPLIPAGLIMVEDRSFMNNFGISLKGIARAAWVDLIHWDIVAGGSTITQQLVRNLYLSNEQTFVRKLKEAIMAILLDAHYSKPAILEAYINEVYLGQAGSHAIRGFGLASHFYFNKPLDELKPSQIALLIGMIKGPSLYNPRQNPKLARHRRNVVLNVFHRKGLLDTAVWKRAKAAPLGVSSRKSWGNGRYPGFIGLVIHQLQDQYTEEQLTGEGLRIFTTLEPHIQRLAQNVVQKQLKVIEKSYDDIKSGSLQAAAVVTSVQGSRVLALVDGRRAGYAGFNRALDIQRNIGSQMKPVTYLTAMKHPAKYSVITPLDDSPLKVKLENGKVWTPHNYSHQSHGTAVPMYYALEHSYNLASARLALQVGIPNVVKTLRQLGFRGNLLATPALSLGAVGMSPFQVAQVYNTIASDGFYKKLTAIKGVTSRLGKPLSAHTLKLKQVIDSSAVYLTTWMMKRVARYGTGAGMYNVLPNTLNVAGKTGTTSDLHDSWFAGFSANRVISVWVGKDDYSSSHLTGAMGALRIWDRIMAGAHPKSLTGRPPSDIQRIPLALTFRPGRSNAQDFYTMGGNTPQQCPGLPLIPFVKGYVPHGVSACESGILSQARRHDSRSGTSSPPVNSPPHGGRSGDEESGQDSNVDESLLDKIF